MEGWKEKEIIKVSFKFPRPREKNISNGRFSISKSWSFGKSKATGDVGERGWTSDIKGSRVSGRKWQRLCQTAPEKTWAAEEGDTEGTGRGKLWHL